MGKAQSMLEVDLERRARKKGLVYKKKKKKKKIRDKDLQELEQPPEGPDLAVDIGRLDLRIGKLLWVQTHPLASESHLMLHSYLGDSSRPTYIVSELVKHYKDTDLQKDWNIIVLRNIKPPKIFGLTSWSGLVLCAVKDENVELLRAPVDAAPNDRIIVPTYSPRPDKPYMKPYKRIYETVIEDLRVNEHGQVVYKDIPLEVEGGKGFITTDTLKECPVKCV